MRLLVSALVALNIASVYCAPQNTAVVESQQVAAVDVVGQKKGAEGSLFDGFQSDAAMSKICDHISCEFMTIGDAKALDYATIASVAAVKADPSPVTKALTPAMVTMSESLQSLAAQKALLESLEAQMSALTSASSKGQQLSESTKGQFVETVSKGIVFSPESKGQFAPPVLSKGLVAAAPEPTYVRPPSKGGSSANTMQYEAMMCPMTMFELGKSQKLSAERKLQLEAATLANAQMAAEKQRLENALAASEMLRLKAQEQAEFNAKYAAEQKAKADMLAVGLNTCTVEKAMVTAQKQHVEETLANTQRSLAEETAARETCDAGLAECQEQVAALDQSLNEQIERTEQLEAELEGTIETLERVSADAYKCSQDLDFASGRVDKLTNDLAREREVREQTEEELMKTMTELSSCQRETRVVSELYKKCQDDLQEATAGLARESAAREVLAAKVDEITQKLRDTEEQLRGCNFDKAELEFNLENTQRALEDLRLELEACENGRAELEAANQALAEEIGETKAQLEAMTAERDQLQATLDATSTALDAMTAAKMTCDANFSECQALSEQLGKQLSDAVMMLSAEKEAREQLTATIAIVQETSMKVQEEVKKLQLENLQLQQQVQKLQSEQEVALALAAGCPPTYEKFGSSCYKYVREKTQWKMAQEMCMKEQGNLVAIENTQEQIFLTDYLKRHGAKDPYSFTSGHKQPNGWKWLGASDNHVSSNYWYNTATQMKMGYDCQAMYLYDPQQYGKWVGLPCHTSAPYVCEYNLVPHGSAPAPSDAERFAILEMAQEAPGYLSNAVRY